jgi:hypothetical protein
MKRKEVKQLLIPAEHRDLYKRLAYCVYNMIASDVPEIEDERKYSKRAVVEIIRDANRISDRQWVARWWGEQERASQRWIKEHEYDQAYRRDMDRAVREVLFGG